MPEEPEATPTLVGVSMSAALVVLNARMTPVDSAADRPVPKVKRLPTMVIQKLRHSRVDKIPGVDTGAATSKHDGLHWLTFETVTVDDTFSPMITSRNAPDGLAYSTSPAASVAKAMRAEERPFAMKDTAAVSPEAASGRMRNGAYHYLPMADGAWAQQFARPIAYV